MCACMHMLVGVAQTLNYRWYESTKIYMQTPICIDDFRFVYVFEATNGYILCCVATGLAISMSIAAYLLYVWLGVCMCVFM